MMRYQQIPAAKSVPMLAMFIREAAKGLKLLQKQGYVFRDLSIHNLMLLPNAQENRLKNRLLQPASCIDGFSLKFIDLGFMTTKNDTSHEFRGHAYYAPPEALPPKYMKEFWDPFALGVVIMQCFVPGGWEGDIRKKLRNSEELLVAEAAKH
eukprot:CAMPEP_0168490032 /NCGR_PEP_ID=MMETSP0228-20121227/68972_1 /TAXON_ID=133427 /ORGANISM="Protoceratium reticulatum, Strain CCCM 535 (=CCMP 1889)" /LENGTH=151 /DNA_ID=CAMNT_0008506727 /DNA_START=60 /DNA_END=512 /DNA_ORIENTATION=+